MSCFLVSALVVFVVVAAGKLLLCGLVDSGKRCTVPPAKQTRLFFHKFDHDESNRGAAAGAGAVVVVHCCCTMRHSVFCCRIFFCLGQFFVCLPANIVALAGHHGALCLILSTQLVFFSHYPCQRREEGTENSLSCWTAVFFLFFFFSFSILSFFLLT